MPRRLGLSRTRGSRAGIGGGAAAAPPTISIAGTVAHGEVLTATHDGDTVQWYAGGVAISGETGSTLTVDRADGGFYTGITCRATGPGGTTESNTLYYVPATHWRDVIDIANAGVISGGVNSAAGGNNTFTAPASGNRPSYTASVAAFGNQAAAAFTTDDYLLDSSYDMGGSVTAFTVMGALRIDSVTNADRIVSYGNDLIFRIDASGRLQLFVGGTGGGTSTGTTAFTTTPKIGGASWTQNGNRRIWLKTTAEDTDADTSPAKSDDQACSIGASTAGTTAIEMTAAFFVLDPSDNDSKRADVVVYMEERFGL